MMYTAVQYERQIKYLDAVIRNGRLAHAYLFYGPEQEGNFGMAKAVAKALHCTNGKTSVEIIIRRDTDDCLSCRMIATDTHPLVTLLDRDHSLVSKKETQKEISIKDIRELKRRFSLAAAGDVWRVAIIHRADTMSTEASDAFLKLLEEPGKRTLLILTAPSAFSVPETIRSRTVALGFPGISGQLADTKTASAVKTALRSGVPELLVLSGELAGDAAERTAAVHTVIAHIRDQMIGAGAGDRMRDARRLKKILDIGHSMDTTNVQPRLALDAVFLAALRKNI